MGSTYILTHDEKALNGLLKQSDQKRKPVELFLPILTVSESNGGMKKAVKKNGKTVYQNEHWSEKAKRHKSQKRHVHAILSQYREQLALPCMIILTRFAPNKLDKHDNLPYSLKWILDAICEVITGDYRPGRADASDEIEVKYQQVSSKEYAVKIEIIDPS